MRRARRVRRAGSGPGLVAPLDETAPWVVVAPPRPVPPAGGLGQTLLGALGSLGMVGFAIVGGNRLFLVIAVAIAAVTLVAALGAHVHAGRLTRVEAQLRRQRWRTHLALQVGGAAGSADAQRAERSAAHPGASGLLARARGGVGLWWEGQAAAVPGVTGDDAWRVRIGSGTVRARQPLVSDATTDPMLDVDPELAAELAAAVHAAARLADAPVLLPWPAGVVLALVGSPAETRPVARAILAELLVRKPPGGLAVTLDTAEPGAWGWLAWVPHDIGLGAAASAGELLVCEPAGPAGAVDAVAAGRRAPFSGRTLLLVRSVRAAPPGAVVLDLGALPFAFGAELVTDWVGLDAAAATRLARSLAPRALPGRDRRSSGEVSLFELVGGPGGGDLRVPLGVSGAADVWLDLREPALGGDGPHGLLIGATGSGKSELLRSLVLGLAWRHPPEEVAFVLADWKGGAAFDDVAQLPHVAGLITNLSDDQRQVGRVAVALRAELVRRQRLLRDAGVESVTALRACDPEVAPPALVVVLDEFGELLAAEPEIIDTLLACGRLGRSLGVHLLLSSQRFEEGRLRGLESHLRYRVCLRVASASESLGVLGVPDAVTLPSEPGWGYLSVDGRLTRFRAAHTSQAARDPTAPAAAVRPLALPLRGSSGTSGPESERARAVRIILSLGRKQARAVWHPPLPAALPWPAVATSGWSLPIGIVDDLDRQAQPSWLLDLETCGHIGVVAGPGAGASSLLRSVVCAGVEALTSSELGLIIADFGGFDRCGLEDLPHLRCVAGPEDPDLALAALRWAAQIVEARGQRARRHGVTGHGGWRRAREAGELGESAGDDAADLLVVVDGLARAREDIEEIDGLLATIAGGGLRVRVRLVVAVQRWGDLRGGVRDLLSTRWELRLADVSESGFSRDVAGLMAGAPAGRVVTADGQLAQAYLPPARPRSRGGGAANARLLPLPPVVGGRPAADLAVRAGDLGVLRCDARNHLLVMGDRGSGRTSLLRRVAVASSVDPLARRLTLVDPRRGLTALARRPGVRWTSGGSDTELAVAALVDMLTARRSGSPSGPAAPVQAAPPMQAAPADPSGLPWWSGPEHLLVVDDADLLPGGAYGGVLAPLAEFVRIGPDLGFGIVLARPVVGLTRNGFEPFTAAVRECTGVTVLLRGDPAEGAVAGGLRARPDRPPGRCSWIGEAAAVDAQLVFDPEPVALATGVTGRAVA